MNSLAQADISSDLVKPLSYINGSWHRSEATFAVTNPATGELVVEVCDAGVEETELAVKAAKLALPAWSALTAVQRAQLMRKWFDLMMSHQDELARLLTLEQGKPLAEAKGEIAYGASFIEWFAEEG